MFCPNCNNEMKDKSYNYYGIGEWDTDYPHALHEEYYCKNCGIKYMNNEWIIPKKFERPTDKQFRTVLFITSRLPDTVDFQPILKTQTSKFINKYFDVAKKINYKYDDSNYDERDYDSNEQKF